MNWLRTNWKIAVPLFLALLFLAGLAWATFALSHAEAKVKEAEQKAAVHEALSDTLLQTARENARHGQIEEAKAAEQKLQLAASEKKRLALAKRVADLEAGITPIPADPVPGSPVDPGERDAWRRAVQSRDDLIAGMKAERAEVGVILVKKDELLASMEQAMQHYKTAYLTVEQRRDEMVKANAQLRLALEAQKGATRAAYWKGFFHGAMAGGAVGAGGATALLRRP